MDPIDPRPPTDDHVGLEPEEIVAAATWGLIDDVEVREAAVSAADAARHEPPFFATLFALVDAAASSVLDHPVRPRVKVSTAGLLRGELDVLKVEIPAVLAAGLVVDRLVVRAEHVRVAPGIPPRLRAGPVTLRAYVCQEHVDRWTRTARQPDRQALTPDGVTMTAGIAGIRMGEVLADLEVHGAFLQLVPKRMTIAGLPAPLVRFFRGYLPLPPLPKGSRITGVRHGEGELAVTFTLEHVDEPLTPDIARRIRSLTRLPLPHLR